MLDEIPNEIHLEGDPDETQREIFWKSPLSFRATVCFLLRSRLGLARSNFIIPFSFVLRYKLEIWSHRTCMSKDCRHHGNKLGRLFFRLACTISSSRYFRLPHLIHNSSKFLPMFSSGTKCTLSSKCRLYRGNIQLLTILGLFSKPKNS